MQQINEQANLFNQIFFEQMEIEMAGLGNLMSLGSLGRLRSDAKASSPNSLNSPPINPLLQINTAPSRWENRDSSHRRHSVPRPPKLSRPSRHNDAGNGARTTA